jgi:hypothetical protein
MRAGIVTQSTTCVDQCFFFEAPRFLPPDFLLERDFALVGLRAADLDFFALERLPPDFFPADFLPRAALRDLPRLFAFPPDLDFDFAAPDFFELFTAAFFVPPEDFLAAGFFEPPLFGLGAELLGADAARPAIAPITPPTTAPTGPAMLPSTAPVAAPAVCFEMGGIEMFSDDEAESLVGF